MKKILLLEDDISLGETIKDLLLESSYEVDYITTGNEALYPKIESPQSVLFYKKVQKGILK